MLACLNSSYLRAQGHNLKVLPTVKHIYLNYMLRDKIFKSMVGTQLLQIVLELYLSPGLHANLC